MHIPSLEEYARLHIRLTGGEAVINGPIALRRMNASDYVHMVRWRQDAEVRRYYSNPSTDYTLDVIAQKYASRVAGTDRKVPIVIEYGGEPVGYAQYYELTAEEKRHCGLEDDLSVYGMDILVGDPRYRSKGIASRAIRMVQRELREQHGADCILLKVHQANASAVRCYEKCGFGIWKPAAETVLYMTFRYPGTE